MFKHTQFLILPWLLTALLAPFGTVGAQSKGLLSGHSQAGIMADRHWHLEVEDLRPNPNDGLLVDRVYFVFHDGDFNLFDFGKPAPEGLRWLANHGYRDKLVDQLHNEVDDWLMLRIPLNIPYFRGDNSISPMPGPVVFEEMRYLSYFGRIYPSDDAFFGNADPKRYRLFDDDGTFLGPFVIDIYGSDILDAGTKPNLEQDLIGLDRHLFQDRGNPYEEPFTSEPVMHHPGFNGSHGNPEGEPMRLMMGGEVYCQETALGDEICHEYDPDNIDFSQPGSPLMRLRVNLSGPFSHGAWSGSYYNPLRAGEGFSIEFFDENPQRALFYWFTFKPDGSGEPTWLIGEGYLNHFHVFEFEIYEVTGGAMASTSNPLNVQLEPWGEGMLYPGGPHVPACRWLQLFLTPLDDELELDLPLHGLIGKYRYYLEALTPELTGMGRYCGETTGVYLSQFTWATGATEAEGEVQPAEENWDSFYNADLPEPGSSVLQSPEMQDSDGQSRY